MEEVTTFVLLDPAPVPAFEWAWPEPTQDERDAWDAIGAVVETIAGHYLISPVLVWGTVIEMELELERETGTPNLGNLLDTPWGVGALGIRVAERVLGPDAASLPSLHLSYH